MFTKGKNLILDNAQPSNNFLEIFFTKKGLLWAIAQNQKRKVNLIKVI